MTKLKSHDKINHAFREHTTNTAFHLTLGKTHIAALYMIKHGIVAQIRLTNRFVPASNGLQERGLAKFEDKGPISTCRHWLTSEGELVYELCKAAGLFEEF